MGNVKLPIAVECGYDEDDRPLIYIETVHGMVRLNADEASDFMDRLWDEMAKVGILDHDEEDAARWIAEENAEMDRLVAAEKAEIDRLRPMVKASRQHDGQLHGIHYEYDEDEDNRVWLAIDLLRHLAPHISWLQEHEGTLTIKSKDGHEALRKIHDTSMDVGCDTWNIEVIPPDEPPSWVSDPATTNQINYLISLGHKGPIPTTKGEAGKLISRLVRKKEGKRGSDA